MGLTIVVGKKGSGKTAFALGIIARELKYGHRRIITNMEIYTDKLEQHLRSEGFECDVANRLVVLGAKDRRFARWWRVRGSEVEDQYGVFGEDPKWEKCVGILYVVDEGQHHYPARGWNSRMGKKDDDKPIGEESNDYLCQERKTGDDTVVTTPSSSLLDKDFRTLSTECVVLDNWYRKAIKGIRASGRFQANIYENCPPQQGEEPVSQPYFRLDAKGLMACYNTAAGAGFIGTSADKDKPMPKAVHWGWAVAGLCVVGFGVWLGFHYALRGGVNYWGKKIRSDMRLDNQSNIVAPGRSAGSNQVVAVERVANFTKQSKESVKRLEIYAITKGTVGYGVDWADGGPSLASDVRSLGRGRYYVDGDLCYLVAAPKNTNILSQSETARNRAETGLGRVGPPSRYIGSQKFDDSVEVPDNEGVPPNNFRSNQAIRTPYKRF